MMKPGWLKGRRARRAGGLAAFSAWLLAAILTGFLGAPRAQARNCFFAELPNVIAQPGLSDTCTTCHIDFQGNTHNVFGDAFELALNCNGSSCGADTWGDNWCPYPNQHYAGSPGDIGNTWAGVSEMYYLDSDNDGYRNALELFAGDDNTTTGRVRHPGYAVSRPCDICPSVAGAVCNVTACNQADAGAKAACLGAQPDTWTCLCGPGYSGDGLVSCTDINGCDAAAKNACADTRAGNACNDRAAPNTGHTCTCNNAAYTGTGGTSCTDYDACTALTPCDNNGDTGSSCTDAVAPAAGNSCTCTTPAYKQGDPNGVGVRSCVNYDACTELNNPCNDGPDPSGTCSDRAAPLTGNTCTCNYPVYGPTAADSNGVVGCGDYDACAVLGNPCNDNGDTLAGCTDRDPPLFGNTCGCSAGYSETAPDANGVRRCLDTNGCAGAPCATHGDSAAQCADVSAAMGSGNTCACSAGYALSITGNTQTCVNIDECASEPCKANGDASGVCTENAPGLGHMCGCGTGYASTGGLSPSCVNIDACTPSAKVACADSRAGNTCNDQAPPGLGYACTCGNAAYVLSDSGLSCEDRDACVNNPCDDGGNGSAQCVDAIAPASGYSCSCGSGFTFNGTTCVDLNECTVNAGRCLHGSCQNIASGGGYTCTCDTGYQIDPPTAPYATVCVLENECTNGNNDCSAFANCVDEDPGFACVCLPGYLDNNPADPGHNCTEIDECASGTHLCAPGGQGGTCSNTPGSYTCDCNPGYLGDGTTQCTNINECANGTHLCAPGGFGGSCTDTPGSYTCTCDPGYSGTGTTQCGNVDECANGTHLCAPGGQGGSCADTAGSYTCACNPGYSGSGTTACTEINECANAALNNCDVNALCFNVPLGSFTCACEGGYEGNGVVCDDIDECDPDDPGHDCSDDATCTNQAGSFDCDCKPGFQDDDPANPGRECSNINECGNGALNDCDVNAFCIDNAGAFSCTCAPGFDDIGAGRDGECININECASDTDDCDTVATCADTPGSFTCTCPAGYADAGSGRLGECSEIDECADEALNLCDANANCTNTDGSYTCACRPGFEDLSSGTPGFVCGNINECAGVNNCHVDADCTDTQGSFTCACKDGYFGDGITCTNLDECDRGTDNCSNNATCTDTPGSFTCACRAGYTGNGVICDDIDECADSGLHDCSINGECQNRPGTYQCVCASGYQGDGVTCTDVDECATQTSNCNANATCTNTIGSFACACNAGFSGNGVVCDDINECLDDALNICGTNAGCINDIPGKYRCECWPTYIGNGVTCFDRDECAAPDACTGGRECKNLVAAGQTDPGYECNCPQGQSATDEASPCAVLCGDGILDRSEGCEGQVEGCANCQVLPNWVCRFDATLAVSTCSNNCSDGFVNPGEECDDGDQNSDSLPDACRSNCQAAHCGDGVIDPGKDEECDDGGDNSASRADACRTDCTLSCCGDGARDSSEECDDGNTDPDDGCSESCVVEENAVCQHRDAGADQCMPIEADAGVLDAGLTDAGLDASGGGDEVYADGGIPPYAPDAKSTTIAGCSLHPQGERAGTAWAFWSLLGLALLVRRRRELR